MLKEIAAYGAVVVGAAGLVLSAAPAQAQTAPASATQIVTSPGCFDDGLGCREQGWRPTLNLDKKHDFNKAQRNKSFNVLNLCDTHILGLDHLLAQNNEQGKCAQSSFNNN